MKILFYDARDYDQESFNAQLKNYPTIQIDYLDADLSPVTASLARGYDAVCAFVNSNASQTVTDWELRHYYGGF